MNRTIAVELPKQTVYTTEEAIALITEIKTLDDFHSWLKDQPANSVVGIAGDCDRCPLNNYFQQRLGDKFHFRVTSEKIHVLAHEADYEISVSAIAYLFTQYLDRNRTRGSMVTAAGARVSMNQARATLLGGDAA